MLPPIYIITDIEMTKVTILPSEFGQRLELQLASALKAGFPSPAEDYAHEAGINDGDIAVIDRSVEAQDGDVVVAYVNNEFTIKYLDLSHKSDGYIELRPANKSYHPIRIDSTDDFEVWGVVVWTIRAWHPGGRGEN